MAGFLLHIFHCNTYETPFTHLVSLIHAKLGLTVIFIKRLASVGLSG